MAVSKKLVKKVAPKVEEVEEVEAEKKEEGLSLEVSLARHEG